MKPLLILGGAGTIGRVVAWDWIRAARAHRVILADRDGSELHRLARRLGPRCSPLVVDLLNAPGLVRALPRGSLVANSTSHHFNLPVMEACLQAHCSYLDLGGLFHFTRRQLKLHSRFRKAGLLAILGMGCAPGLTNIMARELTDGWERVERIDIRLAGVDHHPSPLEAVPYAFRTLLEELTLKPAVFRKGQWFFVPPRSGVETYTFPHPVGISRLFYTLHSEIATLPLFFKERGLRNASFRIGLDPALCRLILNSDSPPKGSSKKRRPLDEEMALVEARGIRGGQKVRGIMSCLNRSNPEAGWSAGDLNTACPASGVAALIHHGILRHAGVYAPEEVVPWTDLKKYLEQRGFVFRTATDRI